MCYTSLSSSVSVLFFGQTARRQSVQSRMFLYSLFADSEDPTYDSCSSACIISHSARWFGELFFTIIVLFRRCFDVSQQ